MAQLAIHGGPRALDAPLGRTWPIWDERERRALAEVLESGVWGRGGWNFTDPVPSKVAQFEQAFARYHDMEHGIAVASGTAALECALVVVGVEPGDEVIIPAATYVADVTCVTRVNARPVIVDVDPATYTIDVDAVAAAVTPRTRAIIAVDLGGMPCDTDRLREVARRHGLILISDCSHAHGSIWRGRKVGSWADIAVFSVMAGKTVAVGEGGVICTDNQDWVARAYSYHHAGRRPGAFPIDHTLPATTSRLAEWEGAIGLCALERLEDQAITRDQNVRYLAAGFEAIGGVASLRLDPRVDRLNPYRWHFKFRVDDWAGITREQLRTALAAEGLAVGIGATRPLYWFGCPGLQTTPCPEAERIHLTEALDMMHWLFLGPRSDMDRALAVFEKMRGCQDELRRVEPAEAILPPGWALPGASNGPVVGRRVFS